VEARIKIFVVSQYLNVLSGGAERYIHEVCTRLVKIHDFSIQYISADGFRGSLVSDSSRSFYTSGFNFRWFGELKQIFKADRPDLIYIHYTVPGISDIAFHVAKKMKIPCAVMYHSDITGLGVVKKILGYLYYTVFGDRILKQCDILYVASKKYAQNSIFLKQLKREKILAPPGIDLSGLNGAKDITGEKEKYILFVGKPDLKEKGFYILKKAWSKLNQKGIEIDLIVVGERNSNSGSEKLSEPGICFTGEILSRDRLYNLYEFAEVTVLPSLTAESFGMVLAEALSAGCPVVGSDIGGIPDLIDEGINGYLAEPGKVESLVLAVEKAMINNTQLKDNIRKSHKLFVQTYNWDRTASIVADSMKQIILNDHPDT